MGLTGLGNKDVMPSHLDEWRSSEESRLQRDDEGDGNFSDS